MANSNASLFITNQLANATPPTGSLTQQATATAKNLLANNSLSYNAFVQTVNFMAAHLVAVMNYIANGALILAAGLFMWQIIIILSEYFITHEAKKFTTSMIRKLILFIIVSGFATHIQPIMSFVFGSFANMGVAAGGQIYNSGGNASAQMGDPLFAWGSLGRIWTINMNIISRLDYNWMEVVKGVPDVLLVYVILLIIALLVIYIVIQFFIIQLEILIQASIGSIAIGFSMIKYTEDITKGYIKSLINMGIRLFTIIIIIYFFNYVILYNEVVLVQLETNGIATAAHPYQIIQNALLSILFLTSLTAFFVAKGPSLVANAMSGSGTGSGMDAGMVMGAAAAGGFAAANMATKMAKGGAKAAYKAPGALVDGITGFTPEAGGGKDGMKETGWRKAVGDWQKRAGAIRKEDFAQPKPPAEKGNGSTPPDSGKNK